MTDPRRVVWPETMIEPHPVWLDGQPVGPSFPEPLRSKRWSPRRNEQRDRAIATAYERGDLVADIAASFDLSEGYTRALLKRQGVQRRSRRSRQNKERDRLVVDMVLEGRTLQDIGNELGLTKERVRQLAAQQGLRTADRPVRRATGYRKLAERTALAEERLKAVKMRHKARRRELVGLLKQLAEKLGRPPTTKEFTAHTKIHPTEVYQLFTSRGGVGSHYGKIGLRRFYRAAGLRPRSVGYRGWVR